MNFFFLISKKQNKKEKKNKKNLLFYYEELKMEIKEVEREDLAQYQYQYLGYCAQCNTFCRRRFKLMAHKKQHISGLRRSHISNAHAFPFNYNSQKSVRFVETFSSIPKNCVLYPFIPPSWHEHTLLLLTSNLAQVM